MEKRGKGFIPVMLTPFKDNGEIDYDALTRLVHFYMNAGASGLFANCLSSEMYELTDLERLKMVEHIVQVVNNEVPVVATGNFGNSIAEQSDFVKSIYNKGVTAVILITGLLADAGESNEVFNERVHNLMDLTPHIPLGFYECPVPYKRVLEAEQLGEFVKTGRVIYHKDTSLDIENVRAKLKAVQGYDFGLYDAYIVNAVNSLEAGAAGLSCIQGNYFPELIVWLCENYDDPALSEQVEKVQLFFKGNMEVMHHVYPVVSKYFLRKRGFDISSFTRRQVGVYSSVVEHRLDQLYRNFNDLFQELDIQSALKYSHIDDNIFKN